MDYSYLHVLSGHIAFFSLRPSFLKQLFTVPLMVKTKVVSSDLNGTCTTTTKEQVLYKDTMGTSDHTMSHMLGFYVGTEAFQEAFRVFKQQTSGRATMQEAFGTAAHFYRGITLRQAIEYTQPRQVVPTPQNNPQLMQYIAGFWDFLAHCAQQNVPFVINSTGYSVTIAAIKEEARRRFNGQSVIHGQIGNRLIFAEKPHPGLVLSERELETLVRDFFDNPADPIYDEIIATGHIELGLPTEAAKAEILLKEYVPHHFPEVKPEEVMHIGDTFGDFGGILGVAQAGGKGVAFNYNQALEDRLKIEIAQNPAIKDHVYFIEPKNEKSDFGKIKPLLEC